MSEFLKRYSFEIVLIILAVVLGYAFSMYVVGERLESIRYQAEVDIADQTALLTTITEVMARGGADAVAESIIKDCESGERNRFDTLLSRLDSGLMRNELLELERLFDRCGRFYAERKSVMVARLDREIDIYQVLIDRLSSVTEKDERAGYRIDEWKKLVDYEHSQSDLFNQLVVLQGEIISTLLAGNAPGSAEIAQHLTEVREAQEMLTYNGIQIANLRSALLPL